MTPPADQTTRETTSAPRRAMPVLLIIAAAVSVALWAVNQIETDAPSADFRLSSQPAAVKNISFADASGATVTLSSFSGRIVVLNLWATWCAPCRREMPTLDRLQAALGGPDFAVVALSIDRAGLDVVAPFYREFGIENLVPYTDTSGNAQTDLHALGIPTTLLLNREGKEIGRLVGPAEWDSPAMFGFIADRIAGKPYETTKPGPRHRSAPATSVLTFGVGSGSKDVPKRTGE